MSSALIRVFSTAFVVGGLAITTLAQAPGAALRRPGTPETTAATPQKRTVTDENANPAAAPTATNGTFVANFTVKLVTPVPSGYQVQCYLYATVIEESATTGTISNEIEDTAGVKATVSGSTATCSVKVPYAWYLSTPSSDTVGLTYYLYIENASAVNGTGEARSSSQYVPGAGAIKVPANNATTTYSIAATL